MLSSSIVKPSAYNLRLFPPDLELLLQVRSGKQSPYKVFNKIEQLFSKRQVFEVLVLLDFVEMFSNCLYEHESHEGFQLNLIYCDVPFHLIDLVFD